MFSSHRSPPEPSQGQLSDKLGSTLSDANAKAKLNAGIQKATDNSLQSEYTYVLNTYTLTPDAYTDRVNVCRPTAEEAVVRSVTVLQASGNAIDDVKGKLQAQLKADGSIAAVIGGGGANVDVTIDNASDQAVKTTLGSGTKSVIVVAMMPESMSSGTASA